MEEAVEAQVEVAPMGRHEVLVEFMLVTVGRGFVDCGLAVCL